MHLLQSEHGVHAGTAVSVAARLAGTFLIRSSDLDLSAIAAGTPVFSDCSRCRRNSTPHVGFMLAAQGFVEGSKTAPMAASAQG